MDKIKLGTSDLHVSKICLGTMTWGEQNTEAEGHAHSQRDVEPLVSEETEFMGDDERRRIGQAQGADADRAHGASSPLMISAATSTSLRLSFIALVRSHL